MRGGARRSRVENDARRRRRFVYWQTLFTHTIGFVQALPQSPQWALLFVVLVSQPFAGTPSQLAKPVLQPETRQLPPMQISFAFGRLQTFPQPPQLLRSDPIATSQPSAVRPLQFANPALQLPMKHAPIVQTSLAFARLQTFPHPPQLLASFRSCTSQPSAGLLLQSDRPAVQTH